VVDRATAAERYPSRPVTFVVPYTAGSQTDSVARLIGQYLHDALGQPVVIENKTGGGGVVAALAVARAQPDGYTLMVTTNTTHAAAPAVQVRALRSDQGFHPARPDRHFPLGDRRQCGRPARSIGELVSYAAPTPASSNTATATAPPR